MPTLARVAAAVLAGLALATMTEAAPRFRAPTVVLPMPAAPGPYAGQLDIDGDGRPDIVAGTSSGLSLFRQQPDGTYAAPEAFLTGSTVWVIATGRANADAAPDVIVCESVGGEQRIRALLNSGGTLTPSPNYAVTTLSLGPGAADFDGDSVLDVAAAVSDAGTAVLFLNDGAGGFAAPTAVALPRSDPANIRPRDFDADGSADLGVSWADSLGVLLGNGDATFAPPIYSDATNPWALGDFDGTPGADAIVYSFNNLSLRRGTGVATFGAPETVFAPFLLHNQMVAGADFDGDGETDLVAAIARIEALRVARGHGDGTFGPGADYPAGTLPNGLDVADLDGDGRLDLLTSALLSQMVVMLMGNGDGTFGGPRALTTADVRDVALADMDGDLDLDAVTVDEVTGNVTTWRGAGDGTFGSPAAVAAGAGGVVVATGRLDADAFPDVLVPIPGLLKIFRNDGAGGLLAPTSVVIAGNPRSIATGDLNGDGNFDVVTPPNSGTSCTVLLGDGLGGFTAAAPLVAPSGSVTRAVIASLGVDAFADLAISNGSQVLVYSGLGNGTFAPVPVVLPTGGATAGTLEAADSDGDGDTDLFAVAQFQVASWRNDGVGGFAPREDLETRPYTTSGAAPLDLRVRDFDGDGAADLFAVPAWASRATALLPGNSPGVFGDARILGGSYSGRAVDVGDVDGDGDLDLVVAASGSTTFGSPGIISTYLNEQDLVGVPGPAALARPGLSLVAAWPSPARGAFSVRYRLATAAPTRIDLHAVSGRRVAGVDKATSTAGEHVARLDGLGRLPAGVYTVVVAQGAARSARKIVLLP